MVFLVPAPNSAMTQNSCVISTLIIHKRNTISQSTKTFRTFGIAIINNNPYFYRLVNFAKQKRESREHD